MNEATLDRKYDRLQEILGELQSVVIAFSAGVDSTLLLKVALDTLGPENVLAVTGRSDSLARAEFEQACRLTESMGAEHVILDTDEFDDPNYVSNPENRCYYCKTNLFGHIERFIAGHESEHGRSVKAVVCGVNVDDYRDHRPGIEAGREHGVRAPLAEAGLTKDDLRELSKRLGLPTFDKPASPCLASRVPYGEPVTPEKLKMIEGAEAFLREMGIQECRVRHHDTMARIEVPCEYIPALAQPDTAARVDRHFRSLGYKYVTLDLRGFRSGSMNEVISVDSIKLKR